MNPDLEPRWTATVCHCGEDSIGHIHPKRIYVPAPRRPEASGLTEVSERNEVAPQ